MPKSLKKKKGKMMDLKFDPNEVHIKPRKYQILPKNDGFG